MAKRRKNTYEFKPDRTGTPILKLLHLTKLQQRGILKWTLYSLLGILLLVVQDVIMSQFRISGATTDLAVCIIALIGIYEGTEEGGVFTLFASAFYWFSGSAPGPYVIALLTVLIVLTGLLRQNFWRRGFASTVLCASIVIMIYEMLLLLIGIFGGLTIWDRTGVFFLTGLLSCAVMVPFYPVVNAISKIGGETWKE